MMSLLIDWLSYKLFFIGYPSENNYTNRNRTPNVLFENDMCIFFIRSKCSFKFYFRTLRFFNCRDFNQ